ncbi:DUF3048 domain-containing protein [Demequina sp. NBRC 110056]|uniref:DUF3048 domain-containing protein n=1 Tax=Demequina sp. NBRC 110056 TaxID=1570345 RepID=UPI0013562C13|nr:DUF3048 domain-containing protein [Demequina sp. NBRC 110056]
MRTQRVASVSALAALTLALAACASPDVESGPATTQSVDPTPSRSAAPAPPDDPMPDVVWPLTGVDAEGADPADLERAALSIKIENTPQARPQSNLQYADIVFEEQVEYGISRFVAVFQSDIPETVGPIRSMRPMDKNIMGSMGGPLIFSGAQRGFINDAASSGQQLIAQDTGGYGFFRVNTKPAPHNLHGTMADFYEQTDATAPATQFTYAYPPDESNVVEEGTTTTAIDINASPRMQPGWEWNAGDGVWERTESGSAHVTADGTQLYASNIVVLWTDLRNNSSGGGSAVPETIVVTDEGTGYVAVGDKYIPITWSKAGQFDPYILETESGEAVELTPGKTWVELVPQSGGAGKGTVSFS